MEQRELHGTLMGGWVGGVRTWLAGWAGGPTNPWALPAWLAVSQQHASAPLLQHGTRLYLVDLQALTADMFYQQASSLSVIA